MMAEPVWDEGSSSLFLPGIGFINLTNLRKAKVLEERRSRLRAESTVVGKVAAIKHWLWKALMIITMKIHRDIKHDIYI